MFSGAEKFNKDISNFDTKKVEKTKEMFKNAKKFDKDISDLDLRNVVNDDNMYNGATEMIKLKNSNKKALGGSRKAKDTQTNNVVVESKDKFFVNMQRGDNSFGFVDDKYKKEVDQTDDAFKGLENSYISTKPKSRAQANNEIDEDGQTQLNEGDRRTRKDQEKKTEMTYNGSKVLGIEIRDEKKVTGGNKDTTQKKLSDDDLYIYLDKETDLKQVEIEDEAGNKVRADVVKVDAGDNAEDEKIANKGISEKKPREGNQGFHVYKVAKPQANVAKNSWEAIFGNANDNNKNNKPGEKSFKFFNKK
jgi:surface protein